MIAATKQLYIPDLLRKLYLEVVEASKNFNVYRVGRVKR